jgi:hypothetical protein
MIVSSNFFTLVVELALLGVQTRARRSTMMRRPYLSDFSLPTAKRLRCCGFLLLARHILVLNFITTSMWSESMFAPYNIYYVRKVSSVDQAVIDLLESVSMSIWGVPGLERLS